MSVSSGRAPFWFLPERSARLGFEDGKQVARLPIRGELLLLGRRESVVLVADDEVVHSSLITVAETEIEDVSSHLFG
jgi:hypothetical protein